MWRMWSGGRRLFVAGILVVAGGAILPAQAPQGGGRGGRGPAAGQTVEKIRPLKPNLYLITGGGANTLVRVTARRPDRRRHEESRRRQLQPRDGGDPVGFARCR